jgi:protein TonB
VTQNLPTYPEAARTAKKQGSVVLQATIGPSGHVSQVRVMDGDSSLSAAATTAVQSWLFDPARLDGRPVESTVLVTMNFRLSQ